MPVSPEPLLIPAVSRRRAALWGLATAWPAWADGLDGELLAHQAAYRPRLAWRPDAAWPIEARALARRHIWQPGDDGSPFDAQLLAQEDRGDHLAQRLSLRLALGQRATALHLRPKARGPHPAVLLLHDHGARFDIGKEKLITPMGDAPRSISAQAWATRYFDGQWWGHTLVQAGYAVLAVDALGWGERARLGFARDDQQALAAHLQQLGLSWAGLIASDDLRALRWLRQQPHVDPARVATAGFSMGALRAWQLAALAPDEVQACVAAHWLCSREGLLRPGQHTLQGQSAYAMLHPGLAAELDHPDVAALIAPRPLLLFGSPQDPLFPWDAVQATVRRLALAWPRGEGERFKFVQTDDGHRAGAAVQRETTRWLGAQLPAA
jgi:dienelactone hydrolase